MSYTDNKCNNNKKNVLLENNHKKFIILNCRVNDTVEAKNFTKNLFNNLYGEIIICVYIAVSLSRLSLHAVLAY